jgi:hypothetical protein
MKKIILPALAFLTLAFSFTGCGEKEILAPMNGVWRCTGVTGTAVGLSTPTTDDKALNLLSVVFGGAAGLNYYARTGQGDLVSDASTIYSTLSGVSSGNVKQSWSDFLTTGTFDYSGNMLTMTSTSGLQQEFTYQINGNTMTLTESVLPTGVGNAVNTVTNIIGSLFGSGSMPETTVGVVYTYEKTDINTIKNLVSGN